MTGLDSSLAVPAPRLPQLRVLLADDAPDVRLLVRINLEMQGFTIVAEATNGAEAVALAEAHQPDVVLLDVAMPVMDGLQALEELRRRCAGIPVVMHSGFAEGSLAEQCLASGAVAYIEKGHDPARLVRVLRESVLGPRAGVEEPPAAVAATGDTPAAPAREAGVPAAPTAPSSRPALSPGRLETGNAALVSAVALFALVLALRMSVDPQDAGNGLSMLYVLPTALLAVRYGLRGGLSGAFVSTLLLGAYLLGGDIAVGAVGWASRIFVFCVVGLGLGLYADQLRRVLASEQRSAAAIVAANQKLAAALEEAHRNNQALEVANADLRQFGYIVSHDLAEPLRTMSGFSSLLETDYRDALDERGVQYLDFIREGAVRMRSLIDDLRAYTRAGQQDLVRADVPLPALVAEVVTSLGATLEERGAVVEHRDLPTVLGDRSALALVLQNLLSNGVKFNVAAQPRVVLEARPLAGAAWEIDVVDNGIGIDPSHHDRVFGLFARLHTREEFPGTGLGLAICKRIVERHGGSIALVPVPAGTCVRLTLPASGGRVA